MFKCNDCGAEFVEPAHASEYRGECWGQPAYERYCACPYCYSGDYDEISDKEDEEFEAEV